MKKAHVLYNPRSGNNTGESRSRKLKFFNGHKLCYYDITKIDDYRAFFEKIGDDTVILAGGDGTLTQFVDNISHLNLKNPIYYYAIGTGNDFLNDVGSEKGDSPFPINEYIENLPVMTANGVEYRFVNGVGGGLDAYSCEKGNELHKKGKKANYVGVAVKGILFDYKPMNATVTVDGKKREFEKVWFASVMKGRYFGGGIMLSPKQDRKEEELTAVIIHKAGKLRLLTIIPLAFSGKHVKYTKYVEIIKGNDIEVSFDRSVSLQIDGETISGLTGYSVKAKKFVTIL